MSKTRRGERANRGHKCTPVAADVRLATLFLVVFSNNFLFLNQIFPDFDFSKYKV